MTQFRPAIWSLEDRCTPATLVVNTLADDFTADNVLTLREANFLVQGGGSTAGFTVGGGRILTAGELAQITGPFTAFGGGAADVINFAPALAGQTLTLALSDPFATAVPGTGLAFASSTTIDGTGAGGVTISGGGQRLFEVFGGTLTVRNVTLANGTAADAPAPLTGGAGGAVLINRLAGVPPTPAGLVASGVTFRNNRATLGGTNTGVDGAIFNFGGSLTVTNCTFTGNAVAPSAAGFAVGVGAGSSQPVKVYNPNGTEKRSIAAYATAYTGGVFVSSGGDVNADGVADVVTSTGVGGASNIRVFSGTDGSLSTSYFGYPQAFTGGVNVAVADYNFDGYADIICGVGKGGGPNVRVFSGKDNSLLFSQFVYAAGFTGGVRVTAADVNKDGFADIICGVGSGGGPNVRVIDGKTGSLLNSFFALPSTFTGGLFLAAGDVNADGTADIVTGVESGGGPNVRAFNANTQASISSFFAYNSAQTGGVRVGTADVNGDGFADYLTGSGPGGTGQVRVISGKDATTNLLAPFNPFGGLVTAGGVNVG